MTYSQRRKAAKKNARLSLKGNWGKSIAVWFILIAIILGIAALMAGTLYAASPVDYDIAVSPSGIHTSAVDTDSLEVSLNRFAYILETEGRFAFEVFEDLEYTHTSPLGTGVIAGFCLFMVLILLPLSLGIYRFYLTMTDGDKPSISELFSLFSSAKKFFGSFGVVLLVTLFSFLWGALFTVVWGVIIGVTVAILVINAVSAEVVLITVLVMYVLFLVTAVLFEIFLMKYYATPVTFVRGNGVYQSVKQSVSVMKKHRFEAFLFELSFIGWHMLGTLTFGLVYIYVLPYYVASYTSFISALTDGEKEEDDFPTYESTPEIPNFTDFLPKE